MPADRNRLSVCSDSLFKELAFSSCKPYNASSCLLYTSDAADDTPCVDLGGRRIIKKIYNAPNNRDVVVSCDKKWLVYLIPKGWITVDGLSLTVVDVGDNWFSFSLIPETLKQTVLGLKTENQKVNLEFDHTVKVIVHTIERMLPEIKENALFNLKKR